MDAKNETMIAVNDKKSLTSKQIRLPRAKTEQIVQEIGNFLVSTSIKSNSTGGVIGLSGGVDSTTTAAIAKRAFDDYNTSENFPINGKKLEVIGYILPSVINNPEDEKDAIEVAKKLGIKYEVLEINPVVEAYKFTNSEVFENKYDKGNLLSRIRANILSTKAASQKKIVLGTGNKDEDFGIGYYTLFGDGAVHCSPIGGLSKRLVKQVARDLGFDKIADRVPTAGLEEGQTDFNDLGYDYDVVELVVEGIDQGFELEEIVVNPQVMGLVEKQISRSKFSNVREIVRDIFSRHYYIALPKSQIIHPPIANVTLDYSLTSVVSSGEKS